MQSMAGMGGGSGTKGRKWGGIVTGNKKSYAVRISRLARSFFFFPTPAFFVPDPLLPIPDFALLRTENPIMKAGPGGGRGEERRKRGEKGEEGGKRGIAFVRREGLGEG